jgi:olefin beta-lactone synthetase
MERTMHATAISQTSLPVRPRGHASGNLVQRVIEHACESPGRPALLCEHAGGRRAVSYEDLLARAARYAAALRGRGIRPGARVLVLVRPDAEVYALLLAILACGLTLVVVDGRRGARWLPGALAAARADVIIAPRTLLRFWPLLASLRRARRFASPAELLGPRGHSADTVSPVELRARRVPADTPAVISFSSGNTGRAKPVVRTHGVLLAQHRALADALPLAGDDVNLPGFPIATLHNLCCGIATVLPPADLRSMADADPCRVLELIDEHDVTSLSGAPAYMARLARAVLDTGLPRGGVRRVAVGGGPVGRALCADIVRAFPNAAAHVVYGATEAEPIALVRMHDVLAAADGAGFLVGRPVRGTAVRLLGADGEDALVGEVAVRGAQVAGDQPWHRTGDIGRRDAQGRLWLLGRVGGEVSVRGRVMHPYVAEAAALSVPGVRVAALVAHRAAPEAELIVELLPGAGVDGVRNALARCGLGAVRVRSCSAIPMDARHASKVERAELVALLEWDAR